MRKTRRKYVYEELCVEVEEFERRENIRTPNFKKNFPFSLEQYINHIKFWKGK